MGAMQRSVCNVWLLMNHGAAVISLKVFDWKAALLNKGHFEEKNRECAACIKSQYLYLLKKNIYNATSGG